MSDVCTTFVLMYAMSVSTSNGYHDGSNGLTEYLPIWLFNLLNNQRMDGIVLAILG